MEECEILWEASNLFAECGSISLSKGPRGKKIREDAARERQEIIHCVEACTTLRMSFSGSEVSMR